MAYATPQQWSHLDYPTATKLNYYKSGLDAVYALLGTYQVNPAVSRRTDNVYSYYFSHKHRWLLYYNAGTIDDPAGEGDDVSLSVSGAWATYDLAQVEWLYPGKLYRVKDVLSCFEDYTGL